MFSRGFEMKLLSSRLAVNSSKVEVFCLDRHSVAGDTTGGLGQRKCPEWRVGILRAGPLPCRGGQPVGLEVPPPGLVSARQPVCGSWRSTLPRTYPTSVLGGTAGGEGSWFL